MRERYFLIASREPYEYDSFREDQPPPIGDESSPLEGWMARDLGPGGELLESRAWTRTRWTKAGLAAYVDLIVN